MKPIKQHNWRAEKEATLLAEAFERAACEDERLEHAFPHPGDGDDFGMWIKVMDSPF